MIYYDLEEQALWEKIKPYLDGAQLRKDAPEEIVKAAERHRELAWDLDRGQ